MVSNSYDSAMAELTNKNTNKIFLWIGSVPDHFSVRTMPSHPKLSAAIALDLAQMVPGHAVRCRGSSRQRDTVNTVLPPNSFANSTL